ncbi:hypothetical protein MPNT_280010 [Candidatus Methylacidithermus pantelleriae]|uniref:Uncharacterized protein n=1 Tax=Candidatus Methylacidithermus pantelleriae TaxID=2744239 RepID=A0A8J2FSS8_9BACT|nr:hypothetical protein MPNT_280010 [Candidatus Methylacidithermus pantelleriae]
MRFAYGRQANLRALAVGRIVTGTNKRRTVVREREGSAVSYGFLRDRKRQHAFASAEAQTRFLGDTLPCQSGRD